MTQTTPLEQQNQDKTENLCRAFLSESLLARRVVCASARQARTSTALTGAFVHVVRRQGVAANAMRLSLVRPAPLRVAVAVVVRVSAEKQVGGIHAEPIVTGVTDEKTVCDRPFVHLVGDAVRADVLCSRPETPVAVQRRRACPRPTSVRLANAPPKLVGQFSVFHSGNIAIEHATVYPQFNLTHMTDSRSTPAAAPTGVAQVTP